ncbi:hypothetical protein LZ32DRAFT_607975 [Colletotrichum eremochloae]|nr:hypothetical protein LZ32DRAFT_607975 [Colletotrichum eremochloae]
MNRRGLPLLVTKGQVVVSQTTVSCVAQSQFPRLPTVLMILSVFARHTVKVAAGVPMSAWTSGVVLPAFTGNLLQRADDQRELNQS